MIRRLTGETIAQATKNKVKEQAMADFAVTTHRGYRFTMRFDREGLETMENAIRAWRHETR